mmetsp:Transcript_115333/g.246490  ORF Transcript_115333/g.246490 Transcript_115333/m.246490 type:complete len:221 (+) Transcript_115333:36-698(+)
MPSECYARGQRSCHPIPDTALQEGCRRRRRRRCRPPLEGVLQDLLRLAQGVHLPCTGTSALLVSGITLDASGPQVLEVLQHCLVLIGNMLPHRLHRHDLVILTLHFLGLLLSLLGSASLLNVAELHVLLEGLLVGLLLSPSVRLHLREVGRNLLEDRDDAIFRRGGVREASVGRLPSCRCLRQNHCCVALHELPRLLGHHTAVLVEGLQDGNGISEGRLP